MQCKKYSALEETDISPSVLALLAVILGQSKNTVVTFISVVDRYSKAAGFERLSNR